MFSLTRLAEYIERMHIITYPVVDQNSCAKYTHWCPAASITSRSKGQSTRHKRHDR